MLQQFFEWYDRHFRFNLILTASLFLLQIVHLVWLTLAVVIPRALEIAPLWPESAIIELLVMLVDYTEIPALITTSIFYLRNMVRGERAAQAAWYLLLLNSQWLHIFWITDEFVVATLTGSGEGTVLPVWLAWIAILIDYAELPVIADLTRRTWRIWRTEGFHKALSVLKED